MDCGYTGNCFTEKSGLAKNRLPAKIILGLQLHYETGAPHFFICFVKQGHSKDFKPHSVKNRTYVYCT